MLAIAPWPLSILFAGEPVRGAALVACGVVSAICWLLIAHLLRPVSRTAKELKELALADGADVGSFDHRDEIGTMSLAAAHLAERVRSNQHRWAGGHGLTGLP